MYLEGYWQSEDYFKDMEANIRQDLQIKPPTDAANLFQTMSPDFAAGFLARMQPASAAAILTGLKPDTAYEVSVLLAGRNALVPKN